ncbi:MULTISPECIES: MFS transporter [Catenuloplanes]|uniref:MFS family permease n=2 Tax=Catenuloplanes TaxID=33874 RepID=A0AAE3YS37_9ACTN|nr:MULTISPECIES: MFS transporter [Catenuloplanes]MDQ0366889.1 MFS family permease [Catenuloplanes indicus]MDR7277607.1 MFS family permease [Catenuloplanes atrovinosus]
MTGTLTALRSFDRPVQLLMVNQLTINIGFYMLMPYLAGHLAGDLAMAAWAIGLILGVRNLSQQGMFLLGGVLADRIGYKPLILAGLGLRVAGFGLLGAADTLTALLVASAATGLAGALFNPAVRAYLAADAGDRHTEAFALFNVFYQAGILTGPLIGLALLTASFQWVCTVAALLFAVLLLAQARALPARHAPPASPDESHAGPGWRQPLRHRGFLLFATAMITSYVLNFQIYLGLPIEVRRITGTDTAVAALFAVSGLLTVAGQVRLTAWAKARWSAPQAITRGLALMAAAFLPLAATATLSPAPGAGPWAAALALGPVLAGTVLLTIATMLVYPFEMAAIVTFAGPRLVGTYYGLYNTLAGIGIAAGNLLTGAAIDTATRHGWPALPWLALTATGLLGAAALTGLSRAGHLHPPPPAPAGTPHTARSRGG